MGRGGMGAVYEARHQTTLRRCAVKLLLSPDLISHPHLVKRFFREAKASAAKAHEMGIVHRDIKPANLFVSYRETGDAVVKLLDFGVAKVKMESVAETSHGLTKSGSMLGTPLYMSPEQARGTSKIDASSDVWSLGVVLYELLSGQSPDDGVTSLGELMVCILKDDTVLPDVPNAFSDGSTARLGLLRIGPDDASGTFLAFVPSVSARYDF